MAGIFNWLGCIPIDTLKTKLQTAPEGTSRFHLSRVAQQNDEMNVYHYRSQLTV
jgi:hypothetical protein